MRKTLFFIAVLIMSTMGFTACVGNNEKPGEFKTLKDAEWPYAEKLFFFMGDSLTPVPDAMELVVRHTNAYEFSNLWVELSYVSEDSLMADTFNITLADDFGRWFGSGEPIITFTDTLRLRHLPDTASTFGLRHVMRVDRVKEIEQVALRPINI